MATHTVTVPVIMTSTFSVEIPVDDEGTTDKDELIEKAISILEDEGGMTAMEMAHDQVYFECNFPFTSGGGIVEIEDCTYDLAQVSSND